MSARLLRQSHRNGNPFDIRLANIVSIPRGLVRQAKIEAVREPGYRNPDVRWGERALLRRQASQDPEREAAHRQRPCRRPGIVWRKSVKPPFDPVWWWASPMEDRPLIGISYLEAVRVYEGRRRFRENIAIS